MEKGGSKGGKVITTGISSPLGKWVDQYDKQWTCQKHVHRNNFHTLFVFVPWDLQTQEDVRDYKAVNSQLYTPKVSQPVRGYTWLHKWASLAEQ